MAEALIKRYDFDFSLKYHKKIRLLLEKEGVESKNTYSRHVLIDDFVHYYDNFEASDDLDEW